MKIIDAHLHLCKQPGFTRLAEAAGEENTLPYLRGQMEKLSIVACVAMAAPQQGDPRPADQPTGMDSRFSEGAALPEGIYYTTGVQPAAICPDNQSALLQQFEQELSQPRCLGMKSYTGYDSFYVTDEVYRPFIERCQQRRKPVIVHTGETAKAGALLRYAHPLTLDDAAVRYPDVTFVMAHFGSPFLADAAQVIRKNPNVWADLSGALEGQPSLDALFEEYGGFFELWRTWLAYAGSYDRILYGSDWPLCRMETYLAFIRRLLPERFHEAVFYQNAKRLFPGIAE